MPNIMDAMKSLILPAIVAFAGLNPGQGMSASVTAFSESSGPVFLLNQKPLNDKDFKPFGQVVHVPAGMAPTSKSAVAEHWDGLAKVRIHQQIEFSILMIRDREHEIAEMKRHVRSPKLLLCQDSDFILLVATRSAPRAGTARPNPEKASAFLVKQGQAVILAKGTWHAPPFPLAKEARFLMAYRDGTVKRDTKVRAFPKAALIRFE
jgi:ureidoglycolate hydrolase